MRPSPVSCAIASCTSSVGTRSVSAAVPVPPDAYYADTT
jgi:hypothetical protein